MARVTQRDKSGDREAGVFGAGTSPLAGRTLRLNGATWFPGQMSRTRRLIRENLPLVGLVIEVVDARAPRVTRYSGLPGLVSGRPVLTVLAKADLADPGATDAWVVHFREVAGPGDSAVAFSAAGRPAASRELLALASESGLRRGRRLPARAMVVGLPNVGKSTLINRLVGRASARTGDRPGVTRGKQWLRTGADLDLLDLPGILVPGRIPARVALVLALLGLLPPQAFEATEVADFALGVLERTGRLPQEILAEPGALGPLERYALTRGYLRAGGRPDLERAAVALVGAFREGRFGRLTLERPAEPGGPV